MINQHETKVVRKLTFQIRCTFTEHTTSTHIRLIN